MTREDDERYLRRMELLERADDVTRLMEGEKLARDKEGVAESAARLARERAADQREREHARTPQRARRPARRGRSGRGA